jgi:predicted nucleic-acid-binding Zn-ribbon protein
MSADNWASCPKCENQKRKLEQELDDKYGVISREDYQELQAELDNLKNDGRYTKHNLGENWNIGIHEDKFNVSYKAVCDKCGYTYTFEHSEVFNI